METNKTYYSLCDGRIDVKNIQTDIKQIREEHLEENRKKFQEFKAFLDLLLNDEKLTKIVATTEAKNDTIAWISYDNMKSTQDCRLLKKFLEIPVEEILNKDDIQKYNIENTEKSLIQLLQDKLPENYVVKHNWNYTKPAYYYYYIKAYRTTNLFDYFVSWYICR